MCFLHIAHIFSSSPSMESSASEFPDSSPAPVGIEGRFVAPIRDNPILLIPFLYYYLYIPVLVG